MSEATIEVKTAEKNIIETVSPKGFCVNHGGETAAARRSPYEILVNDYASPRFEQAAELRASLLSEGIMQRFEEDPSTLVGQEVGLPDSKNSWHRVTAVGVRSEQVAPLTRKGRLIRGAETSEWEDRVICQDKSGAQIAVPIADFCTHYIRQERFRANGGRRDHPRSRDTLAGCIDSIVDDCESMGGTDLANSLSEVTIDDLVSMVPSERVATIQLMAVLQPNNVFYDALSGAVTGSLRTVEQNYGAIFQGLIELRNQIPPIDESIEALRAKERETRATAKANDMEAKVAELQRRQELMSTRRGRRQIKEEDFNEAWHLHHDRIDAMARGPSTYIGRHYQYYNGKIADLEKRKRDLIAQLEGAPDYIPHLPQHLAARKQIADLEIFRGLANDHLEVVGCSERIQASHLNLLRNFKVSEPRYGVLDDCISSFTQALNGYLTTVLSANDNNPSNPTACARARLNVARHYFAL